MLSRVKFGTALSSLFVAAFLMSAGAQEKDAPKKESPKEEPKKVEPKKELSGAERMKALREANEKLGRAMEKAMDDYRKAVDKAQGDFRKEMEALRPGTPRPLDPLGGRIPGPGRLGAVVLPVPAVLADQLGLEKNVGLIVARVMPETPAAKAGFKDNDVLVSLNGKAVSVQPPELEKILRDIAPNAAVDAEVVRKGKKETIKGIVLPEAKGRGARDS